MVPVRYGPLPCDFGGGVTMLEALSGRSAFSTSTILMRISSFN
jgi:hypothetical protein